MHENVIISIRVLRNFGYSIEEIGKRMGLSPRLVRRALCSM